MQPSSDDVLSDGVDVGGEATRGSDAAASGQKRRKRDADGKRIRGKSRMGKPWGDAF